MTLEETLVIAHGRWYIAGIAPEERCVDAGDAGNRRRTLVQNIFLEHAQKFSWRPAFFNV